jgi:hypothetical protein
MACAERCESRRGGRVRDTGISCQLPSNWIAQTWYRGRVKLPPCRSNKLISFIMDTATEIVKFFFGYKNNRERKLLFRAEQANRIVFKYRGIMPVIAENAYGKRGECGVRIEKQNKYGKVVFNQFFANVHLV